LATEASVTVKLELPMGGDVLRADIALPAEPLPIDALQPVFIAIAEAVIAKGVAAESAQGREVACRPGCGACCRQLVPTTEPEARQLAALVAALPEPRRRAVQDRFTQALARLEGSRVLELMRHPERFSEAEFLASDLPRAYFELGVDCPFLEAENCTIHPQRPIACREYLVTTPPERCSRPWQDGISRVPLPGHVSTAVTKIGVQPPRRFARWVPLVLALEWAAANDDELPPRPGPQWLQDFVQQLTGSPTPGAAAAASADPG